MNVWKIVTIHCEDANNELRVIIIMLCTNSVTGPIKTKRHRPGAHLIIPKVSGRNRAVQKLTKQNTMRLHALAMNGSEQYCRCTKPICLLMMSPFGVPFESSIDRASLHMAPALRSSNSRYVW